MILLYWHHNNSINMTRNGHCGTSASCSHYISSKCVHKLAEVWYGWDMKELLLWLLVGWNKNPARDGSCAFNQQVTLSKGGAKHHLLIVAEQTAYVELRTRDRQKVDWDLGLGHSRSLKAGHSEAIRSPHCTKLPGLNLYSDILRLLSPLSRSLVKWNENLSLFQQLLFFVWFMVVVVGTADNCDWLCYLGHHFAARSRWWYLGQVCSLLA